jgi:uncharacterized protein
MTAENHDTLKQLRANLAKLGSLAVAYSGGVDSTFLLKVAHDVLPGRVIAVTARSAIHPEWEFKEASDFARRIGVAQVIIRSNELNLRGFSANRPDRCYVCKRALFAKIKAVACRRGIRCIAEGSNVDDLRDYRPGMRAIKELGIISPLKDVGFEKAAIRKLSQQMGLPTWDKPAYSCLATRFPYGEKISRTKLARVEQAEEYLARLGFTQVRVRYHGDMARIEVEPARRRDFFNLKLMDRIHEKFREIGFTYCALDLKGYRTGSMNEALSAPTRDAERGRR